MLRNRLSKYFINYFKLFNNYYLQIININAKAPSLKIVEQELSPEPNKVIFRVQLSGKNIFPKFTATEILQDMQLLNSFDLSDRKAILECFNRPTKLLINENSLVRYSILAKTYDRSKKKFIFTIIDHYGSEIKHQCCVSDLLKLPDSINGFDKADIFQIGFEAGRESTYLN